MGPRFEAAGAARIIKDGKTAMTKQRVSPNELALEDLPTEVLQDYWIVEFESMNDLPMTDADIIDGQARMAKIEAILEAREALA
jgi:hypothetical protein